MDLAKGALLGSLVLVAAITAMGSLGGNVDKSPEARSTPQPPAHQSVSSEPKPNIEPEPKQLAASEKKEPIKQAGPIKITDLDEAERKIRFIINMNGYLCAKPIEVQQVGSELFGVQCITHRSGHGTANYLVNARTNDVTEI